jgi:hypothetical protein
MTALARRDLLAALLAFTALPAAARAESKLFDDLDPEATARIGQAWLAEHPSTTTAALSARLFPDGWGEGTLAGLRHRVAEDFRLGAVFVHRGWRLSDTEGALFGLLALEA